jgi:hypothetical protein
MRPLARAATRNADETSKLPLIWQKPTSLNITRAHKKLTDELAAFREFGLATRILETTFANANGTTQTVPTYVNEFWKFPTAPVSNRSCRASSSNV